MLFLMFLVTPRDTNEQYKNCVGNIITQNIGSYSSK